VPVALLVLVTLEIALAVLLQATAAPSSVQLANQIALATTFTALALVDLRLAVAVCVLELIVGGASGRWTTLPAGLSGRMMLDLIVGLVSITVLARHVQGRIVPVGRYGWHAALVAVLIPAIWIPIGVLNGVPLTDAVSDGDGDGFAFFGFALVLAAAALRSDLTWLKSWVLVCTVIGALFTLAVALAIVTGLATRQDLVALLLWNFGLGGRIDASEASLRIYFASGLFLQVGIALITWELLRDRRRVWPWVVLAVLVAALLVSFTRGFWLGAVIAAGVVVLFGRARGRPSLRSPLVLVAGGVGIAAFVGFALLGGNAGMTSNLVKLYQAGVLAWHTLERPITGWGLGAVAPNYPFTTGFTYEITYLDRAFKLGLIGLVLFLSLPLRLLRDSWRLLNGRLPLPPGMSAREAVVPLAVLLSVLVVSATNPYMVGSVGIGAVVLMIAWLDPFARRQSSEPER
jgi:hypothetical protein